LRGTPALVEDLADYKGRVEESMLLPLRRGMTGALWHFSDLTSSKFVRSTSQPDCRSTSQPDCGKCLSPSCDAFWSSFSVESRIGRLVSV
jgi:hypothetical protein